MPVIDRKWFSKKLHPSRGTTQELLNKYYDLQFYNSQLGNIEIINIYMDDKIW